MKQFKSNLNTRHVLGIPFDNTEPIINCVRLQSLLNDHKLLRAPPWQSKAENSLGQTTQRESKILCFNFETCKQLFLQHLLNGNEEEQHIRHHNSLYQWIFIKKGIDLIQPGDKW